MPDNGEVIQDGQFDWSGGIDSNAVASVQSQFTPNGLGRNQLAWAINATMRGGGISPRPGWKDLGKVFEGNKLYQGGEVYAPENENPYLLLSFGGEIFRVDPDAVQNKANLSAAFGQANPAALTQNWFCQGETFMVIQAGDGATLPLFWDGTTLRRSHGITGKVIPGEPNINEIPAARAMDYYMGRLWYSQGRKYTAGDIVKGAAGTLPYKFTDSILKVTENPLALGGDGFIVPSNAGEIRALKHTGNLDRALGESELFIFTRKGVYRCDVPVTRADWSNSKEPLQKVVQLTNGSVNDRSVVVNNNDFFFQSLEPGIRSLAIAVRNFGSWGNVTISTNLQRVLSHQDRSRLRYSSGIVFDNRLWQTVLPYACPVGTAFQAVATLDFNPLGNIQKKMDPIWEGVHQGVNMLQLFLADFGGLERAFALIYSDADQCVHLWELTGAELFENGDNRNTMVLEFPSFSFGDPTQFKKLTGGRIFLDRMYGTLTHMVEYRPDFDSCWYKWTQWTDCTARDSDEDFFAQAKPYPAAPLGATFRSPIDLPVPYPECSRGMMRPSNVGFQFQVRFHIKGYCRIRGVILDCNKLSSGQYENMSSCSSFKAKI